MKGPLIAVGAIIALVMYQLRKASASPQPSGQGDTRVLINDCVKVGGQCFTTATGVAVEVDCDSCGNAWS